MKKIIYFLLLVALGSALVSCSNDENAVLQPLTPTNPTPEAKMPVVGTPIITATFNGFHFSVPATVYKNTDMLEVKILLDSLEIPTLQNADYILDYNNISAGNLAERNEVIARDWAAGHPGDTFKVSLVYKADGRPLSTPATQIMLKGYKRGQRILNNGQIATSDVPFSEIKAVVIKPKENGYKADILYTTPVKDTSLPATTLQLPGFDYQAYMYSGDGGPTSDQVGTGRANTLKIKSVAESQVPAGNYNSNGAAKLCYSTYGDYLPSKGDWLSLTNSLKEIFKDEAFYNFVLNGKSLYTSSEISATHIWTIKFSSWTTIQNGTPGNQVLSSYKQAQSSNSNYALKWGEMSYPL